MPKDPSEKKFLARSDLFELLGGAISDAGILRHLKNPGSDFPKPVVLFGTRRWVAAEIHAWLAGKMESRGEPIPGRHLKKPRKTKTR